MDHSELEFFRKLSLEKRQELQGVSNVNENAADTVELDQTRQGRLSRMDALQGQQMSIAAVNRRNQELKNIELAIKRIDENDFGFCQICDNEISRKRLEVNPALTYCIHCAEKLENKK